MEFADFDDDLFEEKHQRSSFVEEYSARMCDPCWFMQVHPDQFVSPDDKLSAEKYVADYLFLNKEYDAALAKYEEILNMLPPGNTTSRRECLESLVRCHILKGTPCEAVNYADKLHSTSRNSDQVTVSCSVLLEVNIAAGRYSEALIAAQTLVTLHPENWHFWVKLGYVYACMYRILLPNVQELVSGHSPLETVTSSQSTNLHSPVQVVVTGNKTVNDIQAQTKIIIKNKFIVKESCNEAREDSACQTSGKNDTFTCKERGLQFVAACLQRGFVILKKTEGTAQGFALDHNHMHQKRLTSYMNYLLEEDLLHCVRAQVHQNDEAQPSLYLSVPDETTEFVDRGCSKFRPNESEADIEFVCQSSFEDHWFKWIK